MVEARETLETYLHLPATREAWLYLNTDRIRSTFVQLGAGSVTGFSISSTDEVGGGAKLDFVIAGADASRHRSNDVTITYEVTDPLTMALLLRAYLTANEKFVSPCRSLPGDLVQLIAPGRLSHPELPGTEGVARDLYDPVLTTALETARADQERAERFVSSTDKLATVAFDYPECAIACVINTRSINQHWPSSYNRGDGALGVLGTIEPGHGDLRLIAPLHIWWQNGAD